MTQFLSYYFCLKKDPYGSQEAAKEHKDISFPCLSNYARQHLNT